MPTFMRALNTKKLPKYEPFWHFDLVTIWLEANFSNDPDIVEKLFKTFKDGLMLREGITIPDFSSVVDEIAGTSYEDIGHVAKKYPLNGICCIEWDRKVNISEITDYCLDKCQQYVIIFKGECIGECYDFRSQYETDQLGPCIDYDKIAHPTRILKVYKKNGNEYKPIKLK